MAYLDKRTGLFIAQVKLGTQLHRKPGWPTKAEAEAWEAVTKREGKPPTDRNLAGPTFESVAKECIAAGGPNGAWLNGRDRSGLDRVHRAIDYFRDIPIGAVDTAALNGWVQHLRSEPRSPSGGDRSTSTIIRYLSAASAVLTYALERTPPYIGAKPKIPSLKARERPRDELPEDIEPQVMQWLGEHGRHREALCIEFFLATGLRSGELRKLGPEQIGHDWVQLRRNQTKNDRDRRVFIDEGLARDMRALIASGGLPGERTVLRALKEAAAACVPGAHIVVHSLRHSFANRLNRRGVPTRTIQSLLGHTDISTTERYITPTEQDHREASQTLRHARVQLGENVTNLPPPIRRAAK